MRLVRLGAVAGVGVLCAAALAMPTYTKVVTLHYKVKKGAAIEKAGCALCHLSKTKLKEYNPYGADLKKVMEEAKTKTLTPDLLKKIDTIDSDKDGVKNGEELTAGTLPGDPKSK